MSEEAKPSAKQLIEDHGDGTFSYHFSYDIPAHGEQIRSLKFREPTGADIVRVGNPLRLNLSDDAATFEVMMSELAGVPPSTIKKLKARDWNAIRLELASRFFYPPTLLS
jgi:hypothetical protein